MKELPKFEARPLFPAEITELVSTEGDFGKFVYERGRELAETKYHDAPALNVARWSTRRKRIEGCNPFVKVLYAEVVRLYGLEPARILDLQLSNKSNEMNPDLGLNTLGTYEDVAFVVIDENQPNEYLAKELIRQLVAREKSHPAIIDLNCDLVFDAKSDCGLSVKIRDDTQINPDYNYVLTKTGKYSSENIDEKTGLPRSLGEGDRQFWGLTSGFSRLCFGRSLGLGSRDGSLADSTSSGRVRFRKTCSVI